MNFTAIDETLGVSQMLQNFSSEGISQINEKLKENTPTASTMMAIGSAAVLGYAAWEQLRFMLWKKRKEGNTLAGEQPLWKCPHTRLCRPTTMKATHVTHISTI